jgi:CRP-like cAMP-binding protein
MDNALDNALDNTFDKGKAGDCATTAKTRTLQETKAFSENDLAVLANAVLFKDIEFHDLKSLLYCLQATVKRYEKGNFIQTEGDRITLIGVVIKGMVEVIQEDALGRKTILTSIGRAGIFGEAIVTAQLPESPVSVVASQDTTICLLHYREIVTTCANNCMFHTQLIQNMLEIMARKTMLLSQKLKYALMKTIRDKVTAYLLDEFQKKAKKTIHLPYNREELADYLSVDRSALSRELSKMREDGLIRYHKNEFTLDFI